MALDGEPVVLPLLPLGAVVVVLLLPVCVVVISRTRLVALSQHLPWSTRAEGVVVVVVCADAIPMPPASNAATAIMPVLIMKEPFRGGGAVVGVRAVT